MAPQFRLTLSELHASCLQTQTYKGLPYSLQCLKLFPSSKAMPATVVLIPQAQDNLTVIPSLTRFVPFLD